MPRLIDPPAGAALDLAEVAARLDESGVDLTDEGSIAHCTALLAGLARNRDFLADSVVAALKASYADQLGLNRYSAQVFLLHRSARGFYLRANLWPSARDAVYAASGPAAFSYGVPHDIISASSPRAISAPAMSATIMTMTPKPSTAASASR